MLKHIRKCNVWLILVFQYQKLYIHKWMDEMTYKPKYHKPLCMYTQCALGVNQ